MPEEIGLKPCPFCDSANVAPAGRIESGVCIKCLDCGARGPNSKTCEMAGLYWNAAHYNQPGETNHASDSQE